MVVVETSATALEFNLRLSLHLINLVRINAIGHQAKSAAAMKFLLFLDDEFNEAVSVSNCSLTLSGKQSNLHNGQSDDFCVSHGSKNLTRLDILQLNNFKM